ncbi:MAG: DUF192 domain-containing protein [Cyanobacteria bacterium P01_H01_bin.15]
MQKQRQWAVLMSLLVVMGCGSAPSIDAIAETDTSQTGQMLPIEATLDIGETTLELEVARTSTEQALGLMFRESLPADRGMLFPFYEERFTQFWMYNVKFPLDMVFLNSGKIVALETNVPPCTAEPCPTYGPPVFVDTVLELNGGRAAELGLTRGQQLTIEYLDKP